jgi:hypothetical protein
MAATATFLTPNITCLEMRRDAVSLSSATGFFIKREDQWFLVSNWHVFAGRSTETGQPLPGNGATPNFCSFTAITLRDAGLSHQSYLFRLGEALDGQATWFEHPTLGQKVDIGVLPLVDVVPGMAKDLLDPEGYDETMWVDLGGELFLPGYPLGLAGPGAMAIWKRASLATSTEFGDGINRFVLVDTASREGMSGSPCLAVANGQYYSLDRATGKMTLKNPGLSCRLLGVYSGRLMLKMILARSLASSGGKI